MRLFANKYVHFWAECNIWDLTKKQSTISEQITCLSHLFNLNSPIRAPLHMLQWYLLPIQTVVSSKVNFHLDDENECATSVTKQTTYALKFSNHLKNHFVLLV